MTVAIRELYSAAIGSLKSWWSPRADPAGWFDDNLASVSDGAVLVGLWGHDAMIRPDQMAEFFTGTNGAPWTGWSHNGQGTADIQGNRGRQLSGATAYSTNFCSFDGDPPISDAEVVFDVELTTVAFDQQVQVQMKWDFAVDDKMVFNLQLLWGNVQIQEQDNGATVNSASTSITMSTGLWHGRIRSVGSDHRFKFWKDGTPEPDVWTVTLTSTQTYPAKGFVLISQSDSSGNQSLVYWDNVRLMAP